MDPPTFNQWADGVVRGKLKAVETWQGNDPGRNSFPANSCMDQLCRLCLLLFQWGHLWSVKKKVAGYARDCNGLNDYLRESALVALKICATDQGQAVLTDTSVWNYKRRNWDKILDSRNVLNCSLSVCKGAKNDPFKYLCKYFNVKANQATLESFESMLNAWEAADQGQEYLLKISGMR